MAPNEVIRESVQFRGGASFTAFRFGLVGTKELVPADKLGWAFSLDLLGSLGLVPLGFALAGVTSARTNPILDFVVAGVTKIGASLVAISLRSVLELR
jgi:hypothetical protein